VEVGQEVAIFRQFPTELGQKRLRGLKIVILPLNLFKVGGGFFSFSALNIAFLNEKFSSRRGYFATF